MALLKLRVAATPVGASGEVAGMRDEDPMCMLMVTCASWQAAKNGSHSPEWIDGSPRWTGISLKHTARTPRRVAADLGGGQLRAPQRHDDQRDEAAARVAAPLVDHPVVVGPHAGEGQFVIAGLGEGLAAEPGEGGGSRATPRRG